MRSKSIVRRTAVEASAERRTVSEQQAVCSRPATFSQPQLLYEGGRSVDESGVDCRAWYVDKGGNAARFSLDES